MLDTNITTLKSLFPGNYHEIINKLTGDPILQSIMTDLEECHSIIASDDFDSKSPDLKEHYNELFEDLRLEVLQRIQKE